MEPNRRIEDYITGNELELKALIHDFEPFIKSIINKYAGNSLTIEDKEEIIADSFFIVWKNKDNNIRALDSYIAEIAKILVKEKLRKRKITYNIEDFEEVAENSNIEIYLEQSQIVDRLEKKFKNLSEIDKKIITLFYYSDKSIKDISKELHLSTMNVKTRLHRIRKKIRNDFYKEGK